MREPAIEVLRNGAVIPALPLVLREDRTLDEQRQRRLIRYYLQSGVGGIAVAVHTTQFEIRLPKHNLFERLIYLARDEIRQFEQAQKKTILCICGVCGPQEQACAEACMAKAAGYDAVLVSPGGLNDLDEQEHLSRMESIADVMPAIGFYLQKSVGGRRFSYDYWRQLCRIRGVVAIKAAPFDRYGTLDLVRAAQESGRTDLTLYTGNDDNIVVDLLTGFQLSKEIPQIRFAGGLLGHWAVWTHRAVELYQQICEARNSSQIDARWLTLAAQVTDCNGAFFDAAHGFSGCITGIHEVLRRQGLMQGIWTLDPQETLSPGQAEQIDRVWKQYPHLNDDTFVRRFLSMEEVYCEA